MDALRKPVCLLLFVLVAGFLAGDSLQSPEVARADIGPIPTPDVCDAIPNATARKICQTGTNPAGAALDGIANVAGLPAPSAIIGDAVGSAAEAIVRPILAEIVQVEGEAVIAALKSLTKFSNQATTPKTDSKWFINQYKLIFGLASAFALIFAIFRVGMSRADPTETGKTGAAIATFVVLVGTLPFVVANILKVTDDVFAPAWMAQFNAQGNTTLDKVQADLADDLSVVNAVAAILIPLIILFLGVMAAVLFDLMLVFRYEVIFVITGLLPVAAAFAVGGRWGGSTPTRVMWTLIGWIVMKPVMVIILTFGLLIMSQGGGIQPVMLGAGILILSVVGTWAVTQMIANHNIRPTHQVVMDSGLARWARGRFASS